MNLYSKTINDISCVLPKNKIIIIKDGMQIFNPTEDMLLADGWKIYIPKEIEISDEELIEQEQTNIIDNIKLYDISDNVNIFYLDNKPMWFDKTMRSCLMLKFQSELAMDIKETSIWFDSEEYKLTPQEAINMIYRIEIYASSCYNTTQNHILNVKKLTNIEDIKRYNFTSNYPEVLYF